MCVTLANLNFIRLLLYLQQAVKQTDIDGEPSAGCRTCGELQVSPHVLQVNSLSFMIAMTGYMYHARLCFLSFLITYKAYDVNEQSIIWWWC